MIKQYGDVLESVGSNMREIIAIPANSTFDSGGRLVMGAGFARQVRDKYAAMAQQAGMAVRGSMTSDGFYGFCFIPGTQFALFQSKRHRQQPSDYNLLEKSIERMMYVINNKKVNNSHTFNTKSIGLMQFDHLHLPLPGVGLGGLDRDAVMEMLQNAIGDDDRFVIWQPEDQRPEEETATPAKKVRK